VHQTTDVTDETKLKQMRLQAREFFLKSQTLGNKDELVTVMLSIVPDTGKVTSSQIKPKSINSCTKVRFTFQQAEFDKAADSYTKALQLDPKLYSAALFIGDCYFRLKQMDKAGCVVRRSYTDQSRCGNCLSLLG